MLPVAFWRLVIAEVLVVDDLEDGRDLDVESREARVELRVEAL